LIGKKRHLILSYMRKRVLRTRIPLTCLTAAMFLTASTPHFACRCPDGRFKPFCLGSFDPANPCCCGGNGCASGAAEEGCCCGRSRPCSASKARGGCCASATAPEQRRHPGPSSVGDARCSKNLADLPVLVPSEVKTAPARDVSPGPFLPTADVSPCPVPPAAPGWEHSQLVHGPPPFDRIIAFEHFLI
jgi:hypothetical protein